MHTAIRYTHALRIGTITILWAAPRNRWEAWHGAELLTFGPTAQRTLDALCNGSPEFAGTVDPTSLELPDDLADWDSSHARS